MMYILHCPWCRDPDTDYEPSNPERELCYVHMLEYEGLSEAGYERMLSEQAKDQM
jgi:hypothetical protein